MSNDFSSAQTLTTNFLQGWVSSCQLSVYNWFNREKTHCYQACDSGTYFFIDKSLDYPEEFYMTSQKPSVKANDLVKIEEQSKTTAYKILEIDFYSDAADIWVARLKKLSASL